MDMDIVMDFLFVKIDWVVVLLALVAIVVMAVIGYYSDKIKILKDKEKTKEKQDAKDTDLKEDSKDEEKDIEEEPIIEETKEQTVEEDKETSPVDNEERLSINVVNLKDNNSKEDNAKEEETIDVSDVFTEDTSDEKLPEGNLFDYPDVDDDSALNSLEKNLNTISSKEEHEKEKEDAIEEQMDLANNDMLFSKAEELSLDDELGIGNPPELKVTKDDDDEKLSVDDIFKV